MTEHLKFRGKLEVKKIEAKKLKLQIDGLRDALRDKLDPFVAIEILRDEMISAQAVEMHTKLIRYREILAEIKQIKHTLGI